MVNQFGIVGIGRISLRKLILISISLLIASGVWGKNLECSIKTELGEELDEKISDLRERTFALCLKCEGNSCKMNVFRPETDPDLEKKRLGATALCKRLFCTPKKINKINKEEVPSDLPVGETKFKFSYKISEKGKIRDVDITSLEGVMNRRDAYRWTNILTKGVIYLPVKVKGKTYEISNLSTVYSFNKRPSSSKYSQKDEYAEKPRKVETDNKLIEIASGTGFLINNKGYFVSNNHVVDICREIKTQKNGDIFKVRILATDEVNDLALGKIDSTNNDFLLLSSEGGALGEEIIVSGFPFQGVLSESVKITKGVISSLSGPGNNYSLLQIDAAVQPGNSGGPILNQRGEAVGVTVSKADAFAFLSKFSTLPENVNFGIKIETVKSFLKANNVSLNKSLFQSELSSVEIASLAQKSTIHLQCWNTLTAAREIFKTNKARNLLVEVD